MREREGLIEEKYRLKGLLVEADQRLRGCESGAEERRSVRYDPDKHAFVAGGEAERVETIPVSDERNEISGEGTAKPTTALLCKNCHGASVDPGNCVGYPEGHGGPCVMQEKGAVKP
jgi:hypothetical protein